MSGPPEIGKKSVGDAEIVGKVELFNKEMWTEEDAHALNQHTHTYIKGTLQFDRYTLTRACM